MNDYGRPTTYKRITPERGSGFILKRIYELTYNGEGDPVTKAEVYAGSKWEGREKEGFGSLLWASMIEDGLIRSVDGIVKYNSASSLFTRCSRSYARAKGHFENGKYVVRYHITADGMGVLFDMMARVNKTDQNKTLNSVGSVAEHDAKKEAWAERNGVTLDGAKLAEDFEKAFVAAADTRDILQKEAVDCAKLAADYAGENQKLRAEKNDLNERLKKLYGRLAALEDQTDIIKRALSRSQNELRLMIDLENK